MENKPRYSRITDLIELILFIQSRTQGVSINDIQEKFGVSRRTAERMRDCLTEAIPQINVINIDDGRKRWGFTKSHLNELINFTPEEIANLENLKTLQEKQNFSEKSKLLDDVVTKVKAFNRRTINQKRFKKIKSSKRRNKRTHITSYSHYFKEWVAKLRTENFGIFLDENIQIFSLINSLFKMYAERSALCRSFCAKKEGSL